jgi:DUF4097 and DUF4098 domain-containing protein YvlB
MRALFVIPVVASSLCLSSCYIDGVGWGEHFNKDFHSSYPLKTGGRLTVETFNGSVEISGWDQDTVDISGTKFGPTQSEADNLQVNIDATADSVGIRVPRPSLGRNEGARFVIKIPRNATLSRITTSNASIRTQDGVGPARLKSGNGSIHVADFRGRLDAETSNSAIELLNVEGDATVHSSNGHIHADRLAGSLDASTSNGSIQASLARADRPVRASTSNSSVELTFPAHFSSDVRVSTNNGGITLRLPESTNARVVARTSNSSVTTDFEIKTQGEITRNHLDGVIGAGGPLIDLSTSNGGIRLLRR